MRRISAYIAIAALLAASCTRADVGPVHQERSLVHFSGEAVTKSGEGAVRCLDALVFRSNGALDAQGRSTGDALSVSLSRGMMLRWYLLGNAPEGLQDISSESELLGRLSMLEESSAQHPVLQGCGQGVVYGERAVTLPLDRLICKVTLRSVSAPFLRDDFLGSTVTLRRVFLMDANGSCPYSKIPSVGVRLNAGGPEGSLSTALQGLLIKEQNLSLGEGKTAVQTSLYCCPDPEGVCSLVIEVDIDSEPNYYRAMLPAMQCNTEYIIKDLVLEGPGASSPSEALERRDVSFTVTVVPWEDSDEDISFD